MNDMCKIKDNKDWQYMDNDGRVGLMLCVECHKPVKPPFRYYSTELSYVIQCFSCGHEQPSWAKRLADEQKRQHLQDLEDRRTDIITLCERIKDAFYEGYSDADTGDYPVDFSWDTSEAKRIHDILYKQAMEQ